MIQLDVGDKIDPNKFGCFKGTTTTYCLLDMIHHWLSSIDPQDYNLRICFLEILIGLCITFLLRS